MQPNLNMRTVTGGIAWAMAAAPRSRRRWLFAAVMILAVPLAAEVGARAWYSLRYGDPTYALYPWLTPLALSETRLDGPQLSGGQQSELGAPVALTPGEHRVQSGPLLDHVVDINASGYRGPDFAEPRTARWRVAAVGGSSTFSGEVPMGRAYPAVMEALWTERHGPGSVEVVNRGLSGASLGDLLDVVEHHVLPHEPDLITVYSAFNSLRLARVSVDLREGAAPLHRRLFYGRSLYYTVLTLAYGSRASEARQGGPQHHDKDEVFRRYEADLEALVARTRAAGVALLFVQQGLLEPTLARAEVVAERVGEARVGEHLDQFRGYTRRHRRLGQIMDEVAERHGVPVVDPRPALLGVTYPDEHFWVGIHLTTEGSRVLAEEVVRQVEELGGLEVVARPPGG